MPRVLREPEPPLPEMPPIRPVRFEELEDAERAPTPRLVRPTPRESIPARIVRPSIPVPAVPERGGYVPPDAVPESDPTPVPPERAPAPPEVPTAPRAVHPASNLHMTIRIGQGAPRFEVRTGDTGEALIKASAERVEFKRPIGTGDNGPPVGMRAFGRVTFSGPGVEGACDELSFTEAGEMLLKGSVTVKTKNARNWSEIAAQQLTLQIGGQAVGTTRTVPAGISRLSLRERMLRIDSPSRVGNSEHSFAERKTTMPRTSRRRSAARTP
jgi:hypothetical protein